MPLPTLLIKGRLVPPTDTADNQKELDEWVPIDYIIEWFRSRANKTGLSERVLILKSETASGKSTAFPPELYKRLVRGKSSAGIICTQPRVATAIENVIEMLKHNAHVMRLGESIGWSTKYNKFRLSDVGLLSATIGTLAQQLRSSTDEEIMAKYKYILIDETHERDMQTDITISMLKNLLLRNVNNPDCPFVVLMSATFDPDPLLKFFGVDRLTNFIWCQGQTAHIEEMWDWNGARTVNDFPRAAATVVEKIVTENPDDDISKADILIFMPGKAEFKETVKWLEQVNEKQAKVNKVFSLLQIDGNAFQKQNKDFMLTVRVELPDHEVVIGKKVYKPVRRVIICTNVAETGLTLENLKYVVDGGFNREIEYNPIYGIRGLITKPAPKSRIRQRRGRAGRKFDGVFYPLYPRFIYDRLPLQQYPQILIEDISTIMMDIITEQLKTKILLREEPNFSIADIDMVDVPTPDALSACMEKLITIGFVSNCAPKWDPNVEIVDAQGKYFGLTKLGIVANLLSMIPLESVRMILSSYYWDCSTMDAITIAAYLTMDMKSFVASAKPDEEMVKVEINWLPIYKAGLPGWIDGDGLLQKVRVLLADDFIQGLVLFNAIKHVIATAEIKNTLHTLREYCDRNNLSVDGCLEFIRLRDDIVEQMLTAKLEVFESVDQALLKATPDTFTTQITKLKYCIYDGYRNNILIGGPAGFRTLSGLSVVIPKLFRDDEAKRLDAQKYGEVLTLAPKYVIYRELGLKYNRKTSIYDVICECVSSMDGFVSIDTDFYS